MEPLEALHQAGKIAAQVRDETKKMIKPGVKVIDICDQVQRRLEQLGGKPAFPTNVDIDYIAAHYCSPINDTMIIPNESLVKLDIGVHVNGYIADTATTVCFDPMMRYLVDAAEAGLQAAINTIRPGVRASQVGAEIEQAIKSHGANPIKNLSGHKLARYIVHAGKSIPNVSGRDHHLIQEGDVYAIEPFAVPPNAEGMVRDGPPSNIYRVLKKRSMKGGTKNLFKFIQQEYRTLPFASRWILRSFPGPKGETAFKELLDSKCIMSYPQLLEKTKAKVAQAEHSVIVTVDGCEITTA
jgi:methionyl aminopeptidase